MAILCNLMFLFVYDKAEVGCCGFNCLIGGKVGSCCVNFFCQIGCEMVGGEYYFIFLYVYVVDGIIYFNVFVVLIEVKVGGVVVVVVYLIVEYDIFGVFIGQALGFVFLFQMVECDVQGCLLLCLVGSSY